jgi:hypothetical protein
MEEKRSKMAKTKKILITSDEGKVIGQHWIAENGETGMFVKNKGFISYKRLLLMMTA